MEKAFTEFARRQNKAAQQKNTAKSKKQGVRFALSTAIKLNQGRRVFDYIRKIVPTEGERQQYYRERAQMPRGFWRGFVRTELFSTDLPKQHRMMYMRSFDFFMNSKRKKCEYFSRRARRPCR